MEVMLQHQSSLMEVMLQHSSYLMEVLPEVIATIDELMLHKKGEKERVVMVGEREGGRNEKVVCV